MKKKDLHPVISEIPIYMPQCQAIANHLISEIRNGHYKPGEKLKSVRSIADQYGVGRQIALSAIQLLARNNLVYTEKGSGTFVRHDLRTDRYNRIGLFINRMNPAYSWETLKTAGEMLAKENYSLILGANFEEDFTLSDWLKKKTELDGILLEGLLDDKLLKSVSAAGIPYVVIGNYDIDAKHPQATADIKDFLCSNLAVSIRKSGCRKIGAILGSPDLRADRESAEGVTAAIKEAGLPVDRSLIRQCEEDAYADIVYLLENAEPRPDFIFVHGIYAASLQKYFANHDPSHRPYVCVSESHKDSVSKDLWDDSIKSNISEKYIVGKAVRMLLARINKERT